MNIFYLDENISKNAQYHCDKHVVKMILEYTQILSSAYYFTGIPLCTIYQLTHENHPCCIWVRESLDNWMWLKEMTLALYDEYKHRYNKIHKSGEVAKNLPIPNIPSYGITIRPLALPDRFKHLNTVEAYRQYYIEDKAHLLQYRNRDLPYWIKK